MVFFGALSGVVSGALRRQDFWILLGFLFLLLPFESRAQTCPSGFECGSEYWDEPHRSAPPVHQPQVSGVIDGVCGKTIPNTQAYKFSHRGLLCGEGAESVIRTPETVGEEEMTLWNEWSRSGHPRAREFMQDVRRMDVSWEGEIEFPVWETWNYNRRVGGFNASRCGNESFRTTCYRDREEVYYETVSYQVCVERKSHPTSPSTGGGSSGSGGGTSPSQPTGPGESREEQKKESDDIIDGLFGAASVPARFLSTLFGTFISQAQADHECLRYETRYREEKRTRPASRLSYSCVKERPSWCVWEETQAVTRSCGNHTATYAAKFLHNDYWTPDYVHSSRAERSYVDILPNQFDLLVGESEEFISYVNTGRKPIMRPAMVLDNHWNEYSVQIVPESIPCRYQMAPHITFDIRTQGRNKRVAPNPLSLPLDENGDPQEALEFEYVDGKVWRPTRIELVDRSRLMHLEAARHSRTFTRPLEASEEDPGAIHKRGAAVGAGASSGTSGGYWHESRFFMQLHRKDKWGRLVRVTLPNRFGSNQGDIYGDRLSISLLGEDGLDPLYRPSGPFEFIFGNLYQKFGVELSPQYEYTLQVSIAHRGLPFYESGCRGNREFCEGEEASRDAFSEPINVTFSPEADRRSWFQRWKDWQERSLIW